MNKTIEIEEPDPNLIYYHNQHLLKAVIYGRLERKRAELRAKEPLPFAEQVIKDLEGGNGHY